MGSMHWSDEESRYLKAILSWEDTPTDEKAAAKKAAAAKAAAQAKKDVAGEFRIVVIGAKGTGKTSILTRFCDDSFRGEFDPPDPFYERGCRHAVEIDGKNYVVDALELPSKHLSSNPMLDQALNITEGAVLVYDVRNPASLNVAKNIHNFIRDSIGTREYGLLLVGNKSDASPDDRKVPADEASALAATFKVQCAFLEVSAKTGDNVPAVFARIGQEIQRAKRVNQQRREEADKAAMLQRIKSQKSAKDHPLKRKGIWKILTFRR